MTYLPDFASRLLERGPLDHAEGAYRLPKLWVHMARPCGTSSRARLIQRKGRKNPAIVKTDRYPNGIPGLRGIVLARIHSANQLYQITCDVIRLCEQAIRENCMWCTTALVSLIADLSPRSLLFHHCMYGSRRRKFTDSFYNLKHFDDFVRMCNGAQEHEAWGHTQDGQWATSREVAYP